MIAFELRIDIGFSPFGIATCEDKYKVTPRGSVYGVGAAKRNRALGCGFKYVVGLIEYEHVTSVE